MIRSVLHYASSIWTSCDKENLGRVLMLQKQAARVISDADNQASSVKLFNRLQWLPFYEESKIDKCWVAYKRIKGEVPLYTEGSLVLNSQQLFGQVRGDLKKHFPKIQMPGGGGGYLGVEGCSSFDLTGT